MASLGTEKTIKLWDAASLRQTAALAYPKNTYAGKLGICPRRRHACSNQRNGEIPPWAVAQQQIVRTLKASDTGLTGAFNREAIESFERLGSSGVVPKGTLNSKLIFSAD